ncbi:MAG TPA: translation initiation factor IF-2 N-terminal domain-containing protein, partial [Anaerovoracaceae bacterium]|nr:translation initiation factor IF-2 N-terminal domain-containing protein [Anaerovoracaceae bacterium]
MPKKVQELAKELGLTDNDLIEKLHELGYENKTSKSVMEDIDAIVVKNSIVNSRKKAETKIVKSSVKKESTKDAGEVKVQIKAVDRAIIEAQARRSQKATVTGENAPLQRPTQAPPAGKPVPRSENAPAARPVPIGRPMPKNAVPLKKSDVPQETGKAIEQIEEPRELPEEKESVRDVIVPDTQMKTEAEPSLPAPEEEPVRDTSKEAPMPVDAEISEQKEPQGTRMPVKEK